MKKNFYKSLLSICAGVLISLSLFSCSDDDEPKLSLSVGNTEVDIYQPSGMVSVRLIVSDPNIQLSKGMFRLNQVSISSQGGLESLAVMPDVQLEDVVKDNDGYMLKISYNLNGLVSSEAKYSLLYDQTEIDGIIELDMERAHVYDDPIIFKVKPDMMARYNFPVFAFLDELKVEHMDFEEIGIREQIFLSEGEEPMYPAMQKDTDKTTFKINGRTSDGILSMMGLNNGKFGQIYSVINQIKLAKPDKDGNEYIWLEFPFVLQPLDKK